MLICVDLGGWQTTEEEWALRGAVLDATELSEANLMVCCSHTHAAPSLSPEGIDVPGGDLVAGYAESVRSAVVDVAKRSSRHSYTGRIDMGQRDVFPGTEQGS